MVLPLRSPEPDFACHLVPEAETSVAAFMTRVVGMPQSALFHLTAPKETLLGSNILFLLPVFPVPET